MASDQYLIVLAISCIGSFRGEAHIESQATPAVQCPCGVVNRDSESTSAHAPKGVQQWPREPRHSWHASVTVDASVESSNIASSFNNVRQAKEKF